MNRNRVKELYAYIGRSTEYIDNDIKSDYLTCNDGLDGREYLHYYDGDTEAAIDIETGKLRDDMEDIIY